jgi:tetratricopeptide (TPR) repeat protein
MSDPLRTDGTRAHDAPAQDRDAKIEQLLLLGLDHYFDARYELAINVWTRALFLDRSHARARAYIERARSAVAERQRESEELLQNGVAAFHRGDPDEARRLLQAAIAGGAPADEALPVLERLNRLPALRHASSADAALDAPARSVPAAASTSPLRIALAYVLVIVAVAAGGYAAWTNGLIVVPLGAGTDRSAATATVPVAAETTLPLPLRGEVALERARSLATNGRIREALAALDEVRPTDGVRSDADRLRADLQRQLLNLSAAPGRIRDKEERSNP